MNLKVLTTKYDGQETTRVIGWQGMYIQEAYQAAKEQMREKVPEGVYVSCCLFGSPAHVSIEVGVWITEINQIPVPTLDAFLDVITKKINGNNNSKSKNDPNNSIEQQKVFERRERPQDTSINHHHLDLLHNKNNDKNITEWLLSKSDGEKLKNTDSSTHVRVKYVSKNNVTKISMLRLDLRYWPTWEVKKDDTNFLGWKYQSFT